MFSNRRQDGCSHTEPEVVKFPVAEIPYSFQLDHVSTLFAKVSSKQCYYFKYTLQLRLISSNFTGLPKVRKWSERIVLKVKAGNSN